MTNPGDFYPTPHSSQGETESDGEQVAPSEKITGALGADALGSAMDMTDNPEDQERARKAMIEEIFTKLGELEGEEITGDAAAVEATFGSGVMERMENRLSASIYPEGSGNIRDRLVLEVPPQFWADSIEPPEDADEDQSSLTIYVGHDDIVKATFTDEGGDWDHTDRP